jgi:hypothetical protein
MPSVGAQDMGTAHSAEHLGEPDLKVVGFQLWVHGRESPDAHDYDDGNWLRVTAHCGASGASVWVQGAVVMVTDIERFRRECEALYEGRGNSARMDPLEPELRVSVETLDQAGHLRVRVEITPDHLSQSHRMDFEIDQSYLPDVVRQCSAIVQQHPIRGNPTRSA